MRWACLLGLLGSFAAWPGSAVAEERPTQTRVNFDERLIKGQIAKAGSVYVYEREELAPRTLIQLKRSFKQKILRTVFER